jgi:hypothetical protein
VSLRADAVGYFACKTNLPKQPEIAAERESKRSVATMNFAVALKVFPLVAKTTVDCFASRAIDRRLLK